MSGVGTFLGLLVVVMCALLVFAALVIGWVQVAVALADWLENRGAPEFVCLVGFMIVLILPVAVGIAFVGAKVATQ